MEFEGVNLEWLHHDCFRITDKEIKIYTDPYKVINPYNDADLILITHDHYDHLEKESIKKLINPNTVIVAQKGCAPLLEEFKNEKIFVLPNDVKIVRGVTIKAVPAYNTNKFNEKGIEFHPKEKRNVGYIFIINNVRVYIAGDTDCIDEMDGFKTDIALLPVSGIYVMNPEEAAQAALKIKPKLAIPMHYGSGIGNLKDAERFKEILKNQIKVEILPSIDTNK